MGCDQERRVLQITIQTNQHQNILTEINFSINYEKEEDLVNFKAIPRDAIYDCGKKRRNAENISTERL